MSSFINLQAQHEKLINKSKDFKFEKNAAFLGEVRVYIEDVKSSSSHITSLRERDQLRANIRYWAGYVYDNDDDKNKKYPNVELLPPVYHPRRYRILLSVLLAIFIIVIFYLVTINIPFISGVLSTTTITPKPPPTLTGTWTFTPTLTTTQTPSPTATPTCQGSSPYLNTASFGGSVWINTPSNCTLDIPTGEPILASGSYADLPSNTIIWVFVYPPNGPFYPQSPNACAESPSPYPSQGNGGWSVPVYFGNIGDTSKSFDLVVMVTDQAGSDYIGQRLYENCSGGLYDGIRAEDLATLNIATKTTITVRTK